MPPPRASLLSYCMLVWHLPLLIGFSVAQRTAFVWGGCMLLRLGKLRPQDQAGVLKVHQLQAGL